MDPCTLLSGIPIVDSYVVKPVKPYITRPFNYKRKLQNLDTELQELKTKVRNLQQLVRDADYHHGRVINEDVKAWLDEAEQLVAKDEERLVEDRKRAKNRCFSGICPNFRTRYQLSEGAETEAAAVGGLRSRAEGYDAVEKISHLPPALATKPIVIGDYEEFQSRESIFNQIIDALTLSDASLIGVYGMGGVGKTTLAKAVAKHAMEKSLFDVVVFCSVTANWKLEKIQEEIIEKLGLKIRDNSASARATQLSEKFKKWNKILVVLDDLWEGLDLKDVGIPSVDDHKGCKILLTSRDRNILSIEMGCLNNIPVDVLSKEEAWGLFKKMAGNIVETSGLQTIAVQVAEECGGLPVAIVTVARALKDKTHEFQWSNALRQLRNPSPDNFTGTHGKVYNCIEFSYRVLANEELKAAFLLCCQMPSNSSSLDLLKYGMGLGIFQNVLRMNEAQDTVRSLIVNLQDSCLLLGNGTSYQGILVHDVVRDVGQSIAKRDHHVFFLSSEDLLTDTNWPDRNHSRMWLSGNISQLTEELNYPPLDLFHFTNKNPDMEVPANFFNGMEQIKVLALAHFTFWSTPLPPSLGLLKNLRTLILDGSTLAEKTAKVLGQLKDNLEILSFVKSNIRRLPEEIGELSKLKILDMSDCSQLEAFPPKVISRLAKLEELYMGGSFSGWDRGGGTNASLAELKQLAHLTNLEIHIPDAEMMVEDLFSGKLKSYRVSIGSDWGWNESYRSKCSKLLKLKLGARIRLDECGINILLKSTEVLHLEGIKGIKNILYELNDEGFPQLKHLHVENNFEIQYVIDATSTSVPSKAFPMLESLILINLASFENICHGEFKTLPFSNLKVIEVKKCPKLKRLFSFPIAKRLLQLQSIEVRTCEILEEIVEEDAASKEIEFCELRSVKLSYLPLFRRFYSRAEMPFSSRRELKQTITEEGSESIISKDKERASLFNEKVVLPKLEELDLKEIEMEILWDGQLPAISSSLQSLKRLRVRACHNLRYLLTSLMIGSLVQLERLDITECRIITDMIVKEDERSCENLKFLKLDALSLGGLPKLKRFCSGNLIECPLLKKFEMWSCPNLETFISSCSLESLTTINQKHGGIIEEENSEKIRKEVTQHLFDEKVAFPSLVELDVSVIDNLEKIWSNQLAATSSSTLRKMSISGCGKLSSIFPSATASEKTDAVKQSLHRDLRNISLWGLPKLKHVLPFYAARDLLQLESLGIHYCNEVEYVVAEEEDVEGTPCFGFPKLTSLNLLNLSKLGSFYPHNHKLECPVLKELQVVDCGIKLLEPKFPIMGEGQLDICIQPAFFLVGQEIPNLEELTLGRRETRMLATGRGSGESPSNLFHTVKVLRLLRFESESDNSSLRFASLLQRFPKLEKLSLRRGYLEVLFSYEGVLVDDDDVGSYTYPRIRHLEIYSVSDLRHIWDEDHRLSSLFQNLETLEVSSSHSLVSLAPSSASFRNLTSLKVYYCRGLSNIMTSCTAKTLEQLKELKIVGCDMLTEIVGNYQKEDETDQQLEIAFDKLQTLTLVGLKSLACFWSGNHTLIFFSLIEVIVERCPRMKTFCHGHLIAPKLYEVRLERFSDIKRSSWEGDLNTTIQKLYSQMVGFERFWGLKLSDFPELKEVWHDDQLTVKVFKNLGSLVVDECAFLSTAVPSSLLSVLNDLELLEVNNCNSLERVFDLEKFTADDGGHVELLASLSKLSLINLPRLNQIYNKDPRQVLEFRNLRVFKVDNCSSLKNIFTPTMAVGLQKLEEMEVRNCSSMEEIITTEAGKEEAEVARVTFPKLKNIILESLPNLNSIDAGNGILEFPSLTEINIDNCPKLDALSILKEQKPETVDEEKEQKLGNKKVVLPLVEILRVDWNETMVEIFGCQLRDDFYGKLKGLEFKHFPNDTVVFPSEILQKFPNLDQLGVIDASFEEIALHDENQGKGFLLGLKKLKLSKLPKLLHLSREESQPWPFLQNLDTLEVTECGRLKVLIPSSLCFQHLTTLEVSKCHGLVHLITCTTAKSLLQLVRMTIAECEMIQVVANEGNNEAGVSITFSKLEFLRLDCLLSLKCFYSGNYAFMFPSLETVLVNDCPKMNFFSLALVGTPMLRSVQRTEEDYNGRWVGDLNATIKLLFTKRLFTKKVSDGRNDESDDVSMVKSTPSTQDKEEPIAVARGFEPVPTGGSDERNVKDTDIVQPTCANDVQTMQTQQLVYPIEADVPSTGQAASDDKCPTSNLEIGQLGENEAEDLSVSNVPNEDSRQGENYLTQKREETQILLETLKDPQKKHPEHHDIPAPSSEQGGTVSGFSASVAEQESNLKSAETNFEPPLASTGQLLEPTPASSSHRASTSNAHEESNGSSIPSSNTLSHSADLMEKILLKTLTAVRNGLLLPHTVENLTKQFNRTALEFIEIDRRGINELKSHCKGYASDISALDAEREKLEKRLGEIEEKKYEVEVKLEDLRGKLVEKERELEEHMDALGLREASSC